MNWEKRNSFQHSLRTLLDVARRLDARGFVAANDGNLSVRLDNTRFLATRSGSSMARITPLDFVVVNGEGKRIDDPLHPGVPKEFTVTSEWLTHSAIYHVRPDVNAVVHAHPPFATAWAVARKPIPNNTLPEVSVTLGAIPLISFTIPGTKELANTVSESLKTKVAVLLANHGVIAIGTDPIDALDIFERVEHAAKIMLLSRLVDGPVALSPEEIAALAAHYPS